jgi:hypothetical protein
MREPPTWESATKRDFPQHVRHEIRGALEWLCAFLRIAAGVAARPFAQFEEWGGTEPKICTYNSRSPL